MGPSSAAVAAGVVWVGNRGNNEILGFDAGSLARVGAVQLAVMPDGLAYVSRSRELWATTPGDKGIKVISLEGKAPRQVADIKLDGSPEGYAVDDARGLFYTNLEDADRTLAIDVRTRRVVASWPSGCGTEGPRGLALDGARRLLFVACTNGARAFDLGHEGKRVGRVDTGEGVDNVEYDARRRRLFVAASRDGRLTIARVTDAGALVAEATVATGNGARNPVTDARGLVYVEHSGGGELLVIDPDAVVRPESSVQEQQPGLLAKAKISPDAAIATAKSRLPKARLTSAEIERERGQLVYSFDFKTDGQSGSDEVVVDALTGKVVHVSHESPKDEAREKAVDAKDAAKKAAPASH
jgi:DNA-binding beta-propeller fold protein YncE